MSHNKKPSSMAYLLKLSMQGSWWFFLTAFLSLVSGVLAIFPFYALYRLIDELVHKGLAASNLNTWAVWIMLAGIAQLLSYTLSMIASHITAFRILRDLRYAIARKLLELPLGWFTKRVSGDTRKLFTEDVEKIELFVAHHVPDLIRAVVSPLTTLGFLFFADWRLALISLIPALLSPLALIPTYRNYNQNMGEYYTLLSNMNGTIIEYIRGMSLVRAFNRTAASFSNYKESVHRYFDFWKNWTLRVLKAFGTFQFLLESGAFFILAIGGPLYLSGAVDLSAFLITLVLGPAYVSSIKLLYFMSTHMTMNLQGVGRIREVLESPVLPEPLNPGMPNDGALRFDQVSFSYGSEPVLSGLDFEIQPGTISAFVGPSGAGKTTAALLAARFYDPASGKLSLGGQDYQRLGTKALMQQVAICFQESQLFKGSLEDNIRMGNKSADFSQVVAAAKAARAHEFIEKLPQAYQTQVFGDRTLSGGQIQRIAIARVILKDAPIVILDEATSYADPENERLIQEALNELLADRTVIVVAHRLKTLKNVDRIQVFEKGRIVESGTWNDLVNNGGTFSRLLAGAETALDWNIHNNGDKEIDYATR